MAPRALEENVPFPLQPDKPSAVLEVIKSPMIFNAFALFIIAILSFSHASPERWWAAFAFTVAVTAWLNVFAAVNPRFLAYGPKEYLRESELAHEREMKQIKTLLPKPSR